MAAAAPPKVTLPPPDGAYLTDGTRLAQVSGLDAQGRFVLADCSADCDQAAELIVVEPDELIDRWMTVEEFERRKRAKRSG